MNVPIAPGLPVPGDRIAGKYDVIRVIGEGGMGIVYEVMHARLQQRAAIKMLQPRVQAMPDVATRFEREARAACRLRSRHAVRITDVDHDAAGRAYIVMEFLAGRDLSEELLTRGRLPVVEAVDVVLQACVAMSEAHASGVVHRDLKPSNLFLVVEGGERVVKVLDFGISKLTTEGEAAVTSTFATMGTPLYMSPEQIRSTKNVDGRTDIWSLGVILFEALSGERPFQGTTTAAAAAIVADEPASLRALAPAVPEALEAVVAKALSKRAEDRFRDVRAFAEALAPFASSRDPLRAIESAALETAGGVPPAGSPTLSAAPPEPSAPSFVHATTMASPGPGSAPSPLSNTLGTSAFSPRTGDLAATVAEPAVVTEAAWANHRGPGGGAGRATKLLAALGLAVMIAGGVVLFRARAGRGSPPPAPSFSASESAASSVAPPLVPPAPATSAPAPSPSPSSTKTPAASSASPIHHSRPHPLPVSSPSASAPPSPPPPASANPLHL